MRQRVPAWSATVEGELDDGEGDKGKKKENSTYVNISHAGPRFKPSQASNAEGSAVVLMHKLP